MSSVRDEGKLVRDGVSTVGDEGKIVRDGFTWMKET